jgi:hypothetical protein
MNRPKWWVSAALLALGCSEPRAESSSVAEPDAAVSRAFRAISVTPGFYTAESQPLQLLADGDDVSIRLASQGGYVMFIGARVNGLEPGPGRLQAELINPETGEVFVSDSRVVQLVVSPDGSGDVEPDSRSASQFAHLLACPNYELRPVHGLDWLLVVRAGPPDGRLGRAVRTVRPICAAGPRYENCVCECQPEYFFGKCGAPH